MVEDDEVEESVEEYDDDLVKLRYDRVGMGNREKIAIVSFFRLGRQKMRS